MGIFLRQTREFRLALALHNDPVQRDHLVKELTSDLAGESVTILTLDLLTPSAESTLLARVQETVRSAPGGGAVAVMVVNLESRADYSPELMRSGELANTFLTTANLHRELFAKACPGPLIIWMTELLERALVTQAPDLWHWRSHVFDLRTRAKPAPSPLELNGERLRSDDYRLHPEHRLQRLEEDLAAYRKTGNRTAEMRALNGIGLARLQTGNARLAKQDFEEVLRLALKLGDRSEEGTALGNLGNVHLAKGNFREAIDYYEQALAIACEIGDRRREGAALGNIGIAHANLGEAEKAIEFYEKDLVIAREIGNRRAEGGALGNIGAAHNNLGDSRKAIEFHKQLMEIAREIGDQRWEGNALGNLGRAFEALGESQKAINFYKQQLAIAREIGDRRGEGNAHFNTAIALDSLGNRTDAIAEATAALAIYVAIEDPWAAKVRAALAEWRGGA